MSVTRQCIPDPGGIDASRMPEKVQRNLSHVWGSYLEWPLSEQLILRVVRVYGYRHLRTRLGAKNSIHSHATTEWVMGISGITRCYVGHDLSSIRSIEISEGDIIEFPAHSVHRIEFVAGVNCEDDVPYAELLEIMAGNNQSGNYKIKRYEPAVAADHPAVRQGDGG